MANPYGQLTSSLLFDACVWPLHTCVRNSLAVMGIHRDMTGPHSHDWSERLKKLCEVALVLNCMSSIGELVYMMN